MDAALEHVLTLIARRDGGDARAAGRAAAELESWRRAAEANEAVYREACARWEAVGSAAAALRGRIARPARTPAPGRRLAKAGAALVVVLALLAGLRWQLAQPLSEQEFSAGPAQLARTQLADGSTLELAADTRLSIALYRDRRTVRLERGEVRFSVAADASRPFTVQTRAGEVRVVGTVFSVRDRGAQVAVAVEHGRVRFAGAQLGAGERLAATAERVGEVERVPLARIAVWRTGWLQFDDVPLAEALAEINAWRREPIGLADAQAGAQRLTASFRADQPDEIPALLQRVLPIEIRRGTAGLEAVSRH